MDDLYFIQALSGPVKIGRAKDARKRLTNLQIGSYEPLTLFGVLAGRGYEERVWHVAFQDARIQGEWYRYTDDLDDAMWCALDGENWWDHLSPPQGFEWSEDPEEHDDDIVDWQIAIQLAVAAARDGGGAPAKQADDFVACGQRMLLAGIERLARESAQPLGRSRNNG